MARYQAARLAFAEPERFGFDDGDTIGFREWRPERGFATPDVAAPAAAGASPTMAEQVSFITGLTADGQITNTSFWGTRDETAFKWGETVAGTGATITYGFAASANFKPREIATFEKALATWAAIADVTFVRAESQDAADVVLRRRADGFAYSEQDTSLGDGSTLGTIVGQATINMNTRLRGGDLSGSLETVAGYGFGTAIHEIGHMLGLGHGGDYNNTAQPSVDQYSAFDHRMYTTMSYLAWYDKDLKYAGDNPYSSVNWGISADNSYRALPHGPMMLDIVAIQQLYGVSQDSPFSGGQTYGFHTNIEGPLRDIYNFNQNRTPVVTIYNQGTGNTLDVSGFAMAQGIDLRPGTFSNIGGLTANVAIALDTVVEKAIGGSGNDYIRASDVDSALFGRDGDDYLIGGSGQDRLTGGAGADAFVFQYADSSHRAANKADVVLDFSRADGDIIDILNIEAKPFQGPTSAFTFIGTDAFNGTEGELRVDYRPSYALVQGDIDGDGKADFAIRVNGVDDLQASDFAL